MNSSRVSTAFKAAPLLDASPVQGPYLLLSIVRRRHQELAQNPDAQLAAKAQLDDLTAFLADCWSIEPAPADVSESLGRSTAASLPTLDALSPTLCGDEFKRFLAGALPVDRSQRAKLDDTAVKGRLIGYSGDYNYEIRLDSGKIITTRHATFGRLESSSLDDSFARRPPPLGSDKAAQSSIERALLENLSWAV